MLVTARVRQKACMIANDVIHHEFPFEALDLLTLRLQLIKQMAQHSWMQLACYAVSFPNKFAAKLTAKHGVVHQALTLGLLVFETHPISSLPNNVHEQTGNILNVHVQTGMAAAAMGLAINGKRCICTNRHNTWAGFIGRHRFFLFSFFLLLHLGVFTTIAVIERALNHLHYLRV